VYTGPRRELERVTVKWRSAVAQREAHFELARKHERRVESMLTSNARYILKNDGQKLKMRDMQTEISANREAIYALEDGLSPIEGRLAEALRASNDEASSLRGRLTDIAASRQGHIDLETLSAQQPRACQSCVQLLRRIQRFESNVMTDREASDLDRERSWGAR